MKCKLAYDLFANMMLIVLPADLLYLYSKGGWIEPNLAILVCELAILPTIAVIGLFRIWVCIREVKLKQERR